MVIVMRPGATEDQLQTVIRRVEEYGLTPTYPEEKRKPSWGASVTNIGWRSPFSCPYRASLGCWPWSDLTSLRAEISRRVRPSFLWATRRPWETGISP